MSGQAKLPTNPVATDKPGKVPGNTDVLHPISGAWGTFMMLPKDKIGIDHSYQRSHIVTSRVKRITNRFCCYKFNVDAVLALKAEGEENTCREPLSPADMMRHAEVLMELERPRAKERQGRPGAERSGNLPEQADRGQARDKVAAVLGVGGRTLDKIQKVAAVVKADPGRNADLAARLAEPGAKVDPLHKEAKRREAEAAPPDAAPPPATPDPWVQQLRQVRAKLAALSSGGVRSKLIAPALQCLDDVLRTA